METIEIGDVCFESQLMSLDSKLHLRDVTLEGRQQKEQRRREEEQGKRLGAGESEGTGTTGSGLASTIASMMQ